MAANAARRLWRLLGREGVVAARTFVEECERHGDQTAARFWTDIAGQLHAMAESGGAIADEASPAGDSTWRLMQRIERYRHRATQAARAVGPEALRMQMVDITAHWLELARETEELAKGIDAGECVSAGATGLARRRG